MGSKQIQDFDIVSLSSADSLVIQNSTGSYKRFIGSDITTPLSSLAARVVVLESATMGVAYETASDYVILDDDNYGYIWVNATTGDKTITLPTLADNQGREILVGASHHGGAVIVDGEGAETIDGNATFKICNQYGFIKLKAITGGWVSISHKSVFDSGWINNSDWTIRQLGNVTVNYTGSTGTFITGEAIYESSAAASTTTGKGGIVASASTLALILRNVTGGGAFTNAYFIHGVTSSAGAVVNGATKNVDTNVTHGLGRNLSELTVVMSYSTTASDTLSWSIPMAFVSGVNEIGNLPQQVDTNTLKIQTGDYSGFITFSTGGVADFWDIEDYFYKISVIFQK